MSQKWSTGFSVILGLAIGLIVAYFGLTTIFARGLSLLHHQAEERLAVAEDQFSGMADECLELRKTLLAMGYTPPAAPFLKVEKSRSDLVGADEFNDKVKAAEALETGLMDVVGVWKKAGQSRKKIGSNFYFQEWGRQWNEQLKFLVKDEGEVIDAVHAYNHLLRRWPVSWIAKGYTLRRMAGVTGLAKAGAKLEEDGRAALEKNLKKGLTFKVGRLWMGVKPDAKDEGKGKKGKKKPVEKEAEPAFAELAMPDFKAEAPLPEDFYPEIQYRDMPSMLAIELGEEAPVLERDQHAPAFLDKKKKKH